MLCISNGDTAVLCVSNGDTAMLCISNGDTVCCASVMEILLFCFKPKCERLT